MPHHPNTGAAQAPSMSEFLAKARKLAEAKPVGAPPSHGKTRNYGAATRKQWSRAAEPAEKLAASDDTQAEPPAETQDAD